MKLSIPSAGSMIDSNDNMFPFLSVFTDIPVRSMRVKLLELENSPVVVLMMRYLFFLNYAIEWKGFIGFVFVLSPQSRS